MFLEQLDGIDPMDAKQAIRMAEVEESLRLAGISGLPAGLLIDPESIRQTYRDYVRDARGSAYRVVGRVCHALEAQARADEINHQLRELGWEQVSWFELGSTANEMARAYVLNGVGTAAAVADRYADEQMGVMTDDNDMLDHRDD